MLKKPAGLCTGLKLSRMALEAGAETLLACGIDGKKHVRGGDFTHHAPWKMCENSTAFEISLVREMTRTPLRGHLLVSHVFACRHVSMTFLKTVPSLVHAPDQASSKQALPRRLSLQSKCHRD